MPRPPKRMFRRPPRPTEAAAPPEQITADVDMTVAGGRIKATLRVPPNPVPPSRLLPVFQTLSDALIANAEQEAVARGAGVSCRLGCAACCRQLIPVSEIETRQIRDLVASLPEPRRSEVRDRFVRAIERLDEAGLLETLRRPGEVADADRNELGMQYYRLGLSCPFLEDEVCTIHPVRPLVCREYLVTSPAENCANPTAETIRRLDLPVRLSGRLASFGGAEAHYTTTWVPLVLALEWAESHPEEAPLRPGPEWLRELFRTWAGRDLPPSA